MYECHSLHHCILPVNGAGPAGVLAPRRTLCITCLVAQFDKLSAASAARALQDASLLLQQSFCPKVGKYSVGVPVDCSTDSSAILHDVPVSLWRSLLSFHDVLAQLAGKLCSTATLRRHVPLYKAALALLSLIFTLLRDAVTVAPSPSAGAPPAKCDCLGVEEREIAANSLRAVLAGLARCVCDAVCGGLVQEGDTSACLLLLTDLADTSPTFLRAVAESCVPSVCAMMEPLCDAYRVELVLYLLHQVFETCAGQPAWLENLAVVLSRTTCNPHCNSFLDYLAWALETFRDDEPVVVNAICLARFVLAYETTKREMLFVARGGGGADGNSRSSNRGDTSLGAPVRLIRNLILLLLYPNADVVVAAAETLREFLIATRLFGECSDASDYVIESLRTASSDSATALVQLLNSLPLEMIPPGPTLRVVFELASNNGKAFEEAVKGPHFMALVTDRFTNVNDVAQRVVQSVQNGNSISLQCFLVQVLCLKAACGGERIEACALLPVNVSMIANTLLHLLQESCGAAFTEDEACDSQWPFGNRLMSLRSETLCSLISVVAFLLPFCQVALLRVAAELLGEALRKFLEWSSVCVDSRITVDNNSDSIGGDALLALSATVLEHVVGGANEVRMMDRLLEQQVRYLLQNGLLTLLLRIPGSSPDLRARVVGHFMCVAEANRKGTCVGMPDPLVMDDSTSLQVLLDRTFCCHPHWAASLLLALATAGCPQPVDIETLDDFFFLQLSLLPCFSDEARRLLAPGVVGDNYKRSMDDEGCAIAVLTALKTCAAYYRWMGDLPRRDIAHLDSCYVTSGVSAVPQELRHLFFLLFRSAEPSWLDALGSRGWGTALLAILVSAAAVDVEGDASTGNVEEAHDHLFSGAHPPEDSDRTALCRLVVRHAKSCGFVFSQLFGVARRLDAAIHSLNRCVIRFLCRCVSLAAGEGTFASTAFIRPLLEQHVTPFLLYRETPDLVGDVARLVVLTLARLPMCAASCCDHTVFKWAMQHVEIQGAQVYVWQILFLLLERTHGSEFALRHEVELEAKLRLAGAGKLPPGLSATLATVRWMVETAMRRRGVQRSCPIVPVPLHDWAQSPPQNALLRAYIISAAERRTRDVPPDAGLLEAAPLLLAWSNDMFARRCATVATARLVYALLRACPKLSASLEALGLLLLLMQVTDTGSRDSTHASVGVEERAWVCAALLSAWPPWGVACGLKAVTDDFLTTLEAPQRNAHGVKRPREDTGDAAAVVVDFAAVSAEEPGVRHAMQALVAACERQTERCGAFPLSRVNDFFLHGECAVADADATCEVTFTAAHEGCELFLQR